MYVSTKVLEYEDWLSIANFAYNMMMGNHFEVPKKKLLDELEKAHLEVLHRQEKEEYNG